jgi:protoheme IX farnesyltransferase
LAINRTADYEAGIPALPVVSTETETHRQILSYILMLVPVSLLPWLLQFGGAFFGSVAIAGDAVMSILALKLRTGEQSRRKAANRLFAFSICYLVFLFGALLIERVAAG